MGSMNWAAIGDLRICRVEEIPSRRKSPRGRQNATFSSKPFIRLIVHTDQTTSSGGMGSAKGPAKVWSLGLILKTDND
jgi:hypothetical protein